jgi:hypothetical protein
MARRNSGSSSSRRSSTVNATGPAPKPAVTGPPPTAAGALALLAQLDDGERQELLGQILFNHAAPLHADLDMILRTCLHAMKSAVRAFVLSRDRHADGGRMWAAQVLHQLKQRWSWRELLQNLPSIPEAVRAVKLLSPDWKNEPLWIDDGHGGTRREPEYERIRKAIRDLKRHAQAKGEKAAEVYQMVLSALPSWVPQSFPGIESYIKLF